RMKYWSFLVRPSSASPSRLRREMTGPTSPTCARPSGSSSRKHFLNHALARSEELADFRGVFAAGFREVGASAAAATDDGCELFHNLSRRDLLDQIWCDTHDDGDLAVTG